MGGFFAGGRVGWSYPGHIPAAVRGVLAAIEERRRWTMTGDDSTLLSVRAEARDLVAPDFAVVDGLIEHTAEAKAEAVRLVAGSLDRLLAELAALGAVPFDAGTSRRPLTWSAHSWTTRDELYHDQETRQMERSGRLTATVAARITVRDMDALENLSGVLAEAPGLNVQDVTWQVDWDNPAWPQVRAAAIGAAIGKARDYAAALGATVQYVEHIADAGLLGDDSAPNQVVYSAAFSRGGRNQTGIPALTPVPQELIATIEARFRSTDVSLPSA
jgi:uncharacterized protein YggE